MNRSMHLAAFFEQCIKIEGACAELYHYYAELFADNLDAVHIWRRAALEEEEHQKQFQLACRLLRDVEFELLLNPQRPHTVYYKLIALLRHVQENPPGLHTALEKSIRMEEQLADLHLLSATNCSDASMRQMFQKMRGYDMEHVQSLRRYLAIEKLKFTEMAG